MKVDFFIVGAMRSGTSSIRDQLDLDPKINMAHGEPMFFSNDKKYQQGFSEYHALFDWSNSDVVLRGEKSPRYAVSPTAPKRVYDYNSEAKIIWMLRDPVKRAISHYIHSVYRAGDNATSLDEAIEKSGELEKSNSTMAYVFRSQYEKQIDAWSKYFPHQKIVILEDLINNSESVMREIYDYLEVDPGIALGFQRHSRAKVDQEKAKIEKSNPTTVEQKEKLFELLEPTIIEIEGMLGRRLDAWRAH